jgi:polyphenol oxidase
MLPNSEVQPSVSSSKTGHAAFAIDAEGILRCLPLLEIPWLVHGFTSRTATRWQNGMPVAALKQIHSARVVSATAGQTDCGEGDALATAEANLLLSVRTADCVPLLVIAPDDHVVAAVHAGWRGVVGGVIPETLRELRERFGVAAASLLVAIGPCIREAAFEVGHEVARQFAPLFPERQDLMAEEASAGKKPHIDLAAACQRQLQQAGVSGERVFDCSYCSHQEATLFHSYRRDREASGRMHSFVGMKPSTE